jgi:peptide/nickel transport system substrate-binding protein
VDKEKIKNLAKKEWHLPYGQKISGIIGAFSMTEKVIFFFFAVLFTISAVTLLYRVNKHFLVEVPDYGGSLVEGVLGSPRFINPVLAVSDIDKDLSTLIYSGLLKIGPDGNLTPDLAENFSISDDGLEYIFTLKDDVFFHDGIKITTDDIAFTIEKVQDPSLKSPREINWSGVLVEVIDEKTIKFSIKQAYSPFLQNATMGILPKHIWSTVSIEEFPFSQFNVKPIGSGPYEVQSIVYTNGGFPSEYKLESFKKYSLGKPYISEITIKSFKTEKDLVEAYKNGNIESLHSLSRENFKEIDKKSSSIVLSPLPRVFGLFFNQNVAPVFINKEVRSALNTAIDKDIIIQNVMGGMGQVIDSPVPPKNIASSKVSEEISDAKIEKAREILTAKGWKLNDEGVFEKKNGKNITTLSFSISTGNATELKESAFILKEQWEKMGAKVDVKIFEIGDLNQNVIKTRKYDSLLFGEVIGRDLDLYPFWHSSQRNAPGLNIAMYTNIKVDKILENIRNTNDQDDLQKYFESVENEIKNDIPAVFTYSPYFVYSVPNKIKNVQLGTLVSPSERFSNVSSWYIETNNVWKIFSEINN